MKNTKNTENGTFNVKKTVGWMILFIAIAAVSIGAVISQSANFSLSDFIEYIKDANPVYLMLALLSMLGFIVFEGLAVNAICKSFGYPRSMKSGFIYSASDIYFSAITPSASGGQPACVWFMMKDGIPVTTSVVALIVNLVFYTLSISVIGTVTFICMPDMFFSFSTLSQLLIIVGYCVLTLLAALFILILFKGSIVYSFATAMIKLLAKIKLVKNPDKHNKKLQDSMYRYKECATLVLKNKRPMIFAFVFNFLQRFSQITVTFFTYLSVGGDFGHAVRAWFVKSYVIVGSNCVPIPGAMGVSDYLLLDGLGNMIANDSAVRLELLSRSISFYSMILICGIAILIRYIAIMKNKGQRLGEPE